MHTLPCQNHRKNQRKVSQLLSVFICELYVKQVKLAEDQWMSELLPLLEDEPFRIVSQQGLVACTDYKVVIKCLEDFYAPVGNELEWQRRFQGRTQKPQEQLLEFVGALRVLADRAYPKWSAEQRKELLRNQFVQGVRSSSVQLKLMKEMPATLEDALTMANQIQTVEEAQKRLQKDRSQMETSELGDSTSNVISGGETNSLEERRLPCRTVEADRSRCSTASKAGSTATV